MKPLTLLFALITLTTLTFAQTATDLQKLSWLEGTWKKVNSKPGKSGYEKWESTSPSSFSGIGITLQQKDTVFLEKLALLVKEDHLYYVADVSENKTPAYFKITAISTNGFTCENPDHDFPKKIVYNRSGRKLKVTVSGGGKSIDFLFEKE